MRLSNKKGQAIENLSTIAIGVAAFAIIMVVVFLILSEGKTNTRGLISSTAHTNLTKTLTNGTAVAMTECIDDEAITVQEVLNGSVAPIQVLSASNYTISLNTITVSCQETPGCAASKNISFTCKHPDLAYNATETLQNASDDIPGWVPIVIITLIGGILIGLVQIFRR